MKYNVDVRAAGDALSVQPRVSFLATAVQRLYRPFRPCVSKLVHFLGLTGAGAAAGLGVAVILLATYVVLCVGTGLGTIVDVVCGLLLGSVVLIAATPVMLLALAIARRIPLRLGALLATALVCLIAAGKGFGLPPALSICLGVPPVLLLVLAGAGVSVLLRRGPGRSGAVRTGLGSLMLLIALGAAAILACWWAAPGTDPFAGKTKPAPGGPLTVLDAPNPSEPGPNPVACLCYGSGADRHRPEYGPQVDLKTDPVDASPFIAPSTNRFEARVRRRYWGFESNRLPLNARVWYPMGEGPFPLVLIVHGNHRMDKFSDPGYAYLGELLASRGFIAASIDENFLNDSWAGNSAEENGARAWLLLKHLELWRTWNEQEGNPFCQKVDLANIALIGHSRGGEAIVHAAMFNRLRHQPNNANVAFHFGFNIKTLIAIAPTNGLYHPPGPSIPIRDINYLVLQGSHDGDLGSFDGSETYRWVTCSGQEYRMKAALYIYRANHGQFNTVWGRDDEEPPLRHLLNRGSLLPPEDQRTIAKVYVAAFLEATLHDRQEYIPLFRDHRRAAHWLPRTAYLSQFQDSTFRTIADFDEPLDVTETSVPGGSQQGESLDLWQQREMVTRRGEPLGYHAVALGWNTDLQRGHVPAQVPSYVITLPDVLPLDWLLDDKMALSFNLADTGARCPRTSDGVSEPARPTGRADAGRTAASNPSRTPIDLTVELVESNGQVARLPLSHVCSLEPAWDVTFTKWPFWERARYRSPVEPVLQTFTIPLADFVKANSDFDPSQLKQIRFRFDRTRSAVILLDEVGLVNLCPGEEGSS